MERLDIQTKIRKEPQETPNPIDIKVQLREFLNENIGKIITIKLTNRAFTGILTSFNDIGLNIKSQSSQSSATFYFDNITYVENKDRHIQLQEDINNPSKLYNDYLKQYVGKLVSISTSNIDRGEISILELLEVQQDYCLVKSRSSGKKWMIPTASLILLVR